MTYTQKMFSVDDMPKLEALLERAFTGANGPLNVVIEPVRKAVRLSNHEIFNLWCEELAKQINQRNTGKKRSTLDAADMSDFLAVGCYGLIDRRIGNVKITRPRQPARLNSDDLRRLLVWVEEWAGEKGFALTIPRDCAYKGGENADSSA